MIDTRHINGEQRTRLLLHKMLNAPREKVFMAWTDEDLLKRWWGPYQFTNPVCDLDARPGGRIYIEMKAADGMIFPMRGIFHEIQKPAKIVFTSTAFEDEWGDKKLENRNTITLMELQDRTLLTLEAVVMHSTPEMDKVMDGMEEGWMQSFEKLAKFLGRV